MPCTGIKRNACPGKAAAAAVEKTEKTVERAYKNVATTVLFSESGDRTGDIKSLDDLSKLPLQLSRTSGMPILLACLPYRTMKLSAIILPRELQETDCGGLYPQRCCHLVGANGRCLVSVGTTRNSVVQNAYGYGLLPEVWASITVLNILALPLSPFRAETPSVRS